MSAENVGGGALEGGQVEGEAVVPDVVGEHGGADVSSGDAVLVGLAEGAVASMEVFRDFLDGEYTDARWKGAVEGSVEVGWRDGNGEREGCDLGEGVDSGVGAAGALREDGLAGDVVDGVSEGSLDGGEVGLDLPTVEGGSVVGEDDLPVRHGCSDGITERGCRGKG